MIFAFFNATEQLTEVKLRSQKAWYTIRKLFCDIGDHIQPFNKTETCWFFFVTLGTKPLDFIYKEEIFWSGDYSTYRRRRQTNDKKFKAVLTGHREDSAH